MEKLFYLLITINTTVIMPDKYTNKECQEVVSSYKNSSIGAICIPSPKCLLLTSENHGSYGSVKCAY